MTSRLLITGATGMIGSLLTDALVARGVEFRIMLRPGSSGARMAGNPGVIPVSGDFDDPSSLREVLQGVDRTFLLTNSTERSETQQLAFVDAARAAGVAHVVKLSQFAADQHSPVRFLRYHAAVEAALQDSGMEWTFVRPNLILQAYLPFAPLIAQGSLQAPIGDDVAVSVVDARDIAAVAAATLTEDGHASKTYTVTGPSAVTHPQIAATLGGAIGREVRFQSVPREAFIAAVTAAGMPQWQAEGLAEDYAHYDRGEANAVFPDVELVTGTRARSVRDFANDYADAFEQAR